jgi:SAM-dependent methyltransferase
MQDLNPVPDTAFSAEQFDAIYPEGIEFHYWNRSRNRILQQVLYRNAGKEDRILEIGCGRGIVVDYLDQRGFAIAGCDLAEIRVSRHLEQIVFPGTDFRHLPEKLIQTTRVVMLLDVLEHLEKPDEFLRSVADTFPNLKTILITVPAGPELWSDFDVFNGHYRRYEKSTLMALQIPSQFTITSLRYFFHSLYLPARIQLLFKKQRKVKIDPPSGFLKKIHGFIAGVLMADFLFLPRNIKGTSLLAILEKR